MNPLTIKELKMLPVGDWVWIVSNTESTYRQIDDNKGRTFFYTDAPCDSYEYADYGKTWVAYKNKEQAEAKGKIKVGDKVYQLANGYVEEEIVKHIQTEYFTDKYSFSKRDVGITLFTDKFEAEKRLAELKGETK